MITYQLKSLNAITPDITHFVLSANTPLVYKAGQYVEATLENGIILPLSIANAPNENGELHFYLRHNTMHPLANRLLDELKAKKGLDLEGPKGHCTLDQVIPGEKIILLAGGTGIAPLKAVLEEALSKKIKNTELYWGVTHKEDAYDLDISSPFKLIVGGWVHEQVVKDHPTLKNYCVFASGPYPMIESAFHAFIEIGLNPDRFFSDMKP